jgi:dipeptidyl aminopeptidase/acylaminoacyl peptidase
VRLSGILVCAFFLLGLATVARGAEFKAGDPVDLKPGEGLLAVDIDAVGVISAAKLDRIGSLFGGTTITDLHWGTNVRLIALPAGAYRWSRLDLIVSQTYLRLPDDPAYRVKIEAGVLNYAGDLNLSPSGSGLNYNVAMVDHAARMMVRLDHDFPGLRRKFVLRYQGLLPDPFPQFLSDELGDESASQALSAGSANALEQAPKDAPAELRPLVEELFAKAQVQVVRLNSRGDLVAMIEYRDGKHRVSLLDTQSMAAVDVYRGDVDVRRVYFAGDRTLLFELDLANGSNNYVVHIDTSPGKAPTFTQFVIPDRGRFIAASSQDGSHATYAHMSSNGEVHIFRIDLTGKRFDSSQFRNDLRLDKALEKAYSGLTDGAGVLRVALTSVNGDYALMYRPDLASPWREVFRHTADEVFDPLMLSADGTSLIVLTNKNRPQTDLVRMTLPGGDASETMYSIPGTDIESALTRDVDRHVLAVRAYRDGRLDTEYLDESEDSLRQALARALPGKSIAIYDASLDRKRVLVLASDEIDPGVFYLYDSTANNLQELLSVVPAMTHVHPARSKILKIVPHDATPIEGYLTLPTQSKPPFPLVVMPHGGPFGVRDSVEYDPEVQLLTNRGYAVLRVNYHGSGGFGRAFEEAGFGAWGKSIEDDILAAIDVAVKAAPIDEDRIALRGASYGGYSTLMGLIRTPERFRCGVAMSAVTDLPLMFTSSDWSQDEHLRTRMMKVVGDPTKTLSEMEAISPDYQYRELNRPLLVIHGALDRRVPIEHALRLLLLLGHAKNPPQSLFLANEGHGISGLNARYTAEAAIDQFLSTCVAPRQKGATSPATH